MLSFLTTHNTITVSVGFCDGVCVGSVRGSAFYTRSKLEGLETAIYLYSGEGYSEGREGTQVDE